MQKTVNIETVFLFLPQYIYREVINSYPFIKCTEVFKNMRLFSLKIFFILEEAMKCEKIEYRFSRCVPQMIRL
jgi:hypothetical protein